MRSAATGRSFVLRARRRAQPPCRAARQGAHRRAPPRHAPAHRPGDAARRDDALRDLLDAWRLRRPAHDRQHLAPQALLGLARSLQHHAGKRPAHPRRYRRRLAAARRPLGLRDGPERLPLDLSPRRTARSPSRPRPRATIRRCSGGSPSMAAPCRFLVFGHLVLGERELEQSRPVSRSMHAPSASPSAPIPDWLWGKRYPDAVYHLVTSTPDAIEAVGGDELLYADGSRASGAYAVLRTTADAMTSGFAVAGSLTDRREAERLAAQIRARRRRPPRCWRRRRALAARHARSAHRPAAAPMRGASTRSFPWLAHNAMIHLTVPHGLEQYTGAAWGTRDVCQGPVEFLLALEHDEPVKEILRIVFAQQYEKRGDWPQWFMLEPYSNIHDRHAHGDVIVWPLKALCDYVEATNDLAFLDEPVAWRRRGQLRADRADGPRRRACRRSSSPRCASASSRARTSSATARATGTIRCSRPTRRCATGW